MLQPARPFAQLVLLSVMTIFVSGCGDSGTEPQSFNQISGTYTGSLAGTAQGVALNATFSITIGQSGGDLSGSYSITGTLMDGVQAAAFQGTGSLTGRVQPGDNPSVNVSLVSGPCPNVVSDFSGSYDTANRRLTVAGPIHVFDQGCQVVLTYPNSTIVLTR